MFAKALRVFSSAIDISNPQKPQEIFDKHWQRIKSIYNSDRVYTVTGKDDNTENPDAADFRHSLDIITKLLIQEYDHRNDQHQQQHLAGSPPTAGELETFNGPCFDLLISRDVVPLLTAAAQTDRPPGMSVHTLEVLRAFIDYFGDALIPQESVHKSLNMLIKVMTRIVTDNQLSSAKRHDIPRLRLVLLRFLVTTVHKINNHNELGNFFLFNHPNTGPEFNLFNALLEFFFEGSDEEQDIARPAILVCCHLDSPDMSRYIASHTKFVDLLCRMVRTEYVNASKEQQAMRQERQAPPAVNAAAASSSSLADKAPTASPSDIVLSSAPPPNRVSKALAFYDECAQRSLAPLQERLCVTFRQNFLDVTLCRELTSMQEGVSIAATHNLRELLYFNSSALLDVVVDSALSSDENPDNSSSNAPNTLGLLLQRVNSASVPLTVATLALFEVMLALNRVDVMEKLVGVHLSRGVFATPVKPRNSEDQIDGSSASPAGGPVESVGIDKPSKWAIVTADELYAYLTQGDAWYKDPGGDYPSPYQRHYAEYMVDAETNVSVVVDTYDDTTLVSESVASPNAVVVIAEAVQQNAAITAESNIDGLALLGPFLAGLFGRVEKMLDQPYAVNVALTGVLSRLAVQLDPLIHTLMLNHRVPTRGGAVGLPAVLRSVLVEAAAEANAMQDFEQRVARARTQLRENTPPVPTGPAVDASERRRSRSFSSSGDQPHHQGDDHVVRAVVVAEEMAKELCAIVAAKAVMRDLYKNLESLYAD